MSSTVSRLGRRARALCKVKTCPLNPRAFEFRMLRGHCRSQHTARFYSRQRRIGLKRARERTAWSGTHKSPSCASRPPVVKSAQDVLFARAAGAENALGRDLVRA